MLKTLKSEGVAPGVEVAFNKFISDFPNLNGVRNSSAHKDERIKEPPNKKLTSGINFNVSECLYGNNFTSTMRNGTIGQVEVSIDSVNKARDCIQMAIDSFQWKGFPRLAP